VVVYIGRAIAGQADEVKVLGKPQSLFSRDCSVGGDVEEGWDSNLASHCLHPFDCPSEQVRIEGWLASPMKHSVEATPLFPAVSSYQPGSGGNCLQFEAASGSGRGIGVAIAAAQVAFAVQIEGQALGMKGLLSESGGSLHGTLSAENEFVDQSRSIGIVRHVQ
jgi:hypothetical protein